MIVSGGENVYSREVEDVLYKHPAVAEAAVVGVPDLRWVERVHAVIALKNGGQGEEKEMIAFCKEHIASYKAPKSIEYYCFSAEKRSGKNPEKGNPFEIRTPAASDSWKGDHDL